MKDEIVLKSKLRAEIDLFQATLAEILGVSRSH